MSWLLLGLLLGCPKPPAVLPLGVDPDTLQLALSDVDRAVAAWVPVVQFDRGQDFLIVVIPVVEKEGVLVVGKAEALVSRDLSVTREPFLGAGSVERVLGGSDVVARPREAGTDRASLGASFTEGFAQYAAASASGDVAGTVAAVEALLTVTELDFWQGEASLWTKRAALGDWSIAVVRDEAAELGIRTGGKTVTAAVIALPATGADPEQPPRFIIGGI